MVELLGEKSRKEVHGMRLKIHHTVQVETEKEENGENLPFVFVIWMIHRAQEEDDLNQDVAYEDEGNEYEIDFNNSDNSFGMDDSDGEDGPVF